MSWIQTIAIADGWANPLIVLDLFSAASIFQGLDLTQAGPVYMTSYPHWIDLLSEPCFYRWRRHSFFFFFWEYVMQSNRVYGQKADFSFIHLENDLSAKSAGKLPTW